MNSIRPPSIELLQFVTEYFSDVVTMIRVVLTPKLYHVMPLGCSIHVPSLSWIGLSVPELVRLQFSSAANFYVFFFERGVSFQISSFWPPKGTFLAGTTYNDVLCVYIQNYDLWHDYGKWKRDTNFHASNWLFAQTTHVDI